MRLSAESRYASFAEISFRIEVWILQRIETQIILIPLKTAKNQSGGPGRRPTFRLSNPAVFLDNTVTDGGGELVMIHYIVWFNLRDGVPRNRGTGYRSCVSERTGQEI
jgi:hypothetical protein